jgi:hypothetical protein
VDETVDRARLKFLPLIGRNLQFWLPVQILQFLYVPEELQVMARPPLHIPTMSLAPGSPRQ